MACPSPYRVILWLRSSRTRSRPTPSRRSSMETTPSTHRGSGLRPCPSMAFLNHQRSTSDLPSWSSFLLWSPVTRSTFCPSLPENLPPRPLRSHWCRTCGTAGGSGTRWGASGLANRLNQWQTVWRPEPLHWTIDLTVDQSTEGPISLTDQLSQ